MRDQPPGWATARVSDLGTVVTGTTPSTLDVNNWNGAVAFVTPGDMKHLGTTSTTERSVSDLGSRFGRMLPPGTVLVTCIGNLGRTTITDRVCITNQQINAIVPANGIVAKYLAYACGAPRFQEQLRNVATTTTVPLVNKSNFARLELPVAPTEEQKRIVAAIEEQLSRLDAGVAALGRVRQNLKRLRSAMLAAAVTGGLDKGARPETQSEGTLGLPKGWEVKQLKSLCELENGDRSSNYPSKRQRVESGIPFINAGHLNGGRVTTDSMDYISRERFDLLRAGKVRDGDLLFCLRGSLGKAAIVEGIGVGAIASSLVIVRPRAAISGPYLLAYLLSPLAHEMIRKFDNGTAQPNLSAKDLGRFDVPVPDRAKQAQIVETLAAIQTSIAHLETSCAQAMTRYEHLRSAILAAAFSGQLVPRDAKDAPASVLLERIATERASANDLETMRSYKPRATPRAVRA